MTERHESALAEMLLFDIWVLTQREELSSFIEPYSQMEKQQLGKRYTLLGEESGDNKRNGVLSNY